MCSLQDIFQWINLLFRNIIAILYIDIFYHTNGPTQLTKNFAEKYFVRGKVFVFSLKIVSLCTTYIINCAAGGVGFDINCGVRLVRTNLTEKDVAPVKEQLAQVCIHTLVS